MLYARGEWVLEVLRHVNIGSDLVRPTTERICGRRSVIAYFKQNPEPSRLASGALELMKAEGQSPRIYSAVGEDWVPSSAPPPRESPGYSDIPPPPGVQHQLAQLEAQLLGLAAVQQGLVARLERLEERFASRTPARERREPAVAAPAVAGREAPASSAAPQRQQPAAPQSPRAPAPPAPPAPVAAAAPAPAPPPPVVRAEPLRIPPPAELGNCIAMLVGNNVTVQQAIPFIINERTPDCYAASLLDDGGEQVGLILMDIKATVYLGGTLMMLPPAQLEQQVRSASPEEDSIAASAEVCNALAGPINACQTNYHVRVGAFQRFDFHSFPWTSEPAQRCDLADSFGGRIAILSRAV